jgi:hypothetical protein
LLSPWRPVFLVTGQVITADPAGPAGVSITASAPGQNAGQAGPLQELSLGGTTEVMPVTAVPYLGRGLDPRLFQPRLLAKTERANRTLCRAKIDNTDSPWQVSDARR